MADDQQRIDDRAARRLGRAGRRRKDNDPEFKIYGLADGLRSAEFAGGNSSAGCRTPDGKLWFPSIHGIVRVDPEHIQFNSVPPIVHIEQLAVDGAALNLNGEIDVKPGQEKWEFQYTASSLLVPERTRFKYRLAGFDKDWIDAGNRRIAYYTHLPPGGLYLSSHGREQ